MPHFPVHLHAPYQPRPVRFLELWETQGWRLKVYGIAYRGERPREALAARARTITRDCLPPAGDNNYGVGFIGIHEGRDSNFIFVDWWANENELYHRAYVALGTDPDTFRNQSHSGLMACVWDLSVLAYERQAWIDCVLRQSSAPDVEGYLSKHMNEDL